MTPTAALHDALPDAPISAATSSPEARFATLRAKLAPTPELIEIARRAVWFQSPEATLANPLLFLAHLMTYTLDSDVVLIESRLTRAEIGWALDHAPAGVFDAPSWHFWHARIGRETVAPMPVRIIPDAAQ